MRMARVQATGRHPGRRLGRAGFTLVEIMMVLAILGIILGVALPAMVGTVRKAPMRQAVSDLEEGFLKARMLAILTGQPAELLIRASDGTLLVRPVSELAPADGDAAFGPEPAEPPPAGAGEEGTPRPEPLPRFSAQLPESITFKQLTVNLRDVMDETEAVVRFQPNGTCDALTASLFSEAGEERLLQLEITTGRLRVETVR